MPGPVGDNVPQDGPVIGSQEPVAVPHLPLPDGRHHVPRCPVGGVAAQHRSVPGLKRQARGPGHLKAAPLQGARHRPQEVDALRGEGVVLLRRVALDVAGAQLHPVDGQVAGPVLSGETLRVQFLGDHGPVVEQLHLGDARGAHDVAGDLHLILVDTGLNGEGPRLPGIEGDSDLVLGHSAALQPQHMTAVRREGEHEGRDLPDSRRPAPGLLALH